MLSARKGRYAARLAASDEDLRAAQRLRHRAFLDGRPENRAGEGGARGDARDADAFDTRCRHVLVEEQRSGTLVCCFRLMAIADGGDIGQCYSAQYYELSRLRGFAGPMVEMGRFCIDPDWKDPDILRVAWGAMAREVDEGGVEMLFGCASFEGTEAERYMDAFALLRERHLGPKRWLPQVKAPRVFRFAQKLRRRPDMSRALRAMPPLLRSYLALGGWVSDHAVVDAHMNTLHVFTGLEIRAIPPARARWLRAGAAV